MYFIERTIALLVIQLGTFALNLKALATTLGFSVAEVKEAEDDAAYIGWVEKCLDAIEAYNSAYIAYMHMVRFGEKGVTTISEPIMPVFLPAPTSVNAGVQVRFAEKARKAKANPACTSDMQKLLGIAAIPNPAAKGDEVPDIKVKDGAGYPTIRFHKYDNDGMNLYRDKGDGKGYSVSPFKTLLFSPFADKDLPAVGQTAVYKYKGIYLAHDKETGNFSPEVSITVVGR